MDIRRGQKRGRGDSVAKKRCMTSREKRERADLKKYMQEEGLLPPDKPRLNRKKFIEEAEAEWDKRDIECLAWDLYLMEAAFCMMGHTDMRKGGISPEAVGAAKVLKLALRLQKFSAECKKKGKRRHSTDEWYKYIKDIMEA